MLLPMWRTIPLLAFLVLATCTTGIAKDTPKRAIPCKTPAIAASCRGIYGWLTYYSGISAYRLWEVGTRHLWRIYSGPSMYHPDAVGLNNEDSKHPKFPANIRQAFEHSRHSGFPSDIRITGEFEICPLGTEPRQAVPPACIESATDVLVQQFE